MSLHTSLNSSEKNSVQVLAITGKGGIGKTNIAVNLGASLVALGKTVYVLDANFGFAGLQGLLGIKSKYTLKNFIQQECSLDDVVQDGPLGVRIIPGFCPMRAQIPMQPQDYAALIYAFHTLIGKLDTLIIDTASGITDAVLTFAAASQEILVVIDEDPTAMSDAQTLIEIMHKHYHIHRFRIIVNMSSSLCEAKKLFAKLTKETEKYLNVVLHFLGWIPEDELVRKAIKQQGAVVELYPSCQASQSFKQLAEQLCNVALPNQDSDRVQFFIEQLITSHIVVQ